MITGLGTDIVEISRIGSAEARHQLSKRILSQEERDVMQKYQSKKRQYEFLAGRFAAKEAYAKALGTGIGKTIKFQDIICLNDEKGKPYFKNNNEALVSISHSDSYATATVILTCSKED